MKKNVITEKEFLMNEIKQWENSNKRKMMIVGERYYRNRMDIETKRQPIAWKSNAKLVHGFVKKLVDQKIGYVLSKEPSISTENKVFQEKLNDFFDEGMLNKLKKVGKESINKGVAYLYPY